MSLIKHLLYINITCIVVDYLSTIYGLSIGYGEANPYLLLINKYVNNITTTLTLVLIVRIVLVTSMYLTYSYGGVLVKAFSSSFLTALAGESLMPVINNLYLLLTGRDIVSIVESPIRVSTSVIIYTSLSVVMFQKFIRKSSKRILDRYGIRPN